jgi:hypothetical protein
MALLNSHHLWVLVPLTLLPLLVVLAVRMVLVILLEAEVLLVLLHLVMLPLLLLCPVRQALQLMQCGTAPLLNMAVRLWTRRRCNMATMLSSSPLW